MGLKDLWEKIKRSPSVNYPHYKIKPENILDENVQLEGDFEANRHYFEVRIVSQFLKDKREYWSKYNPISVVLTEFSFAGSKQAIPFVVGPKLLAKLEMVKDNHEVRYINTRVVGPTPYVGDQVALFTGLFRMRTGNWAVQALDLLQSVATTFDATKLTKYVNISKPLMEGIEGFLGMEDMEMRLGHRIEYTDSSIASVNKFQPGYWVMIRSNDELDKNDLKVKDNVLMYTDKDGKLIEYRDEDYIIYSIEKLDKRNDYHQFEFHETLKKIQDAIWKGNGNVSKDLFYTMLKSISLSEDLTQTQRNELQIVYKDLVKNEIEKYKETKEQDSMFDLETTPRSLESSNKYDLVIRKAASDMSGHLSLADVVANTDIASVNNRINDSLNILTSQSVDMSGFDSQLLSEKLYEEILKL